MSFCSRFDPIMLFYFSDIKKEKVDGNMRKNIASCGSRSFCCRFNKIFFKVLFSISPKKFSGIECCSSVYRIGKSSYTMVDDEVVDETEQLGYCLDFNVTFPLLKNLYCFFVLAFFMWLSCTKVEQRNKSYFVD